MTKCYLCGCELTNKNESLEHIVPNALGGKLKSKALLCKKCNNNTGNLEEHLCNSLVFFISALEVKRERGKIPTIRKETESGRKIFLDAGLKPRIQTEFELKNGYINLSAPNEEKAKQIILRLKKKYPKIDMEKILCGMEVSERYLDEGVGFDISLNKFSLRAIVKSILNYALINNITIHNQGEYVDYINGKNDDVLLKMYNGASPYTYKEDIISLVAIIKSRELHKIVGYLQFFGFYKFYLELDNDYNGDNEHIEYIFYSDGNKEDINFDISSFEKEFDVIGDIEKLKEDLSLILNKTMNLIGKKEVGRLIGKDIDEMQEKFPKEENPIITDEMINFLSFAVADKIAKFYISQKKIGIVGSVPIINKYELCKKRETPLN